MAISISLTGSLTFTEGSDNLLSKNISETRYASGNEMLYQRRIRISDGATETITLPTTTGKFLYAKIQSGGPLTFRLGAATAVPLEDYVLIKADFTVLTFSNASGSNCDLELAVVAED